MAISNPEIVINGQPVPIVPNSFSYDEGEPEKNVRAAVIGDSVTQEFSKNQEEAFSNFKFSMYPSADNLDLIRTWEKADNTNTVTSTAGEVVSGVEKTWRRTFKNASISNKVDKPVGFDAVIEINWKSDAAV
jgi:hypothetical protein